jgi:hypothetical protein
MCFGGTIALDVSSAMVCVASMVKFSQSSSALRLLSELHCQAWRVRLDCKRFSVFHSRMTWT